MSVHKCGRGCHRQIYVSSIPGGGAPVALPNAGAYVAAALQCHTCGRYICKPCANTAPALSPMHACPACGGKLAWPGVLTPGGSSGAEVLGQAASSATRASVKRAVMPSNSAARLSFMLACVGAVCCVTSFLPATGCIGVVINGAALAAGVAGVLKARWTGVGMGLALAGLALALVNLLIIVVALVMVGLLPLMKSL